jgi:hypothetical protein
MNKLDEIEKELKLLKANLMPSLRMPGLSIPKPKMPSLGAKNKKNPIKIAQQIKSPEAKMFAMRNAVSQVKSQTNQLAFKTEESPQKFHVVVDNKAIHHEPLTRDQIDSKYKVEIESGRAQLVPVVQERLKLSSNGQWEIQKV